jgi:hypothetical protein
MAENVVDGVLASAATLIRWTIRRFIQICTVFTQSA